MDTDQIDIQSLVHRYCDALCLRNCDAWVATFAKDGMWNSGHGEVVGHTELSAAILRIMEIFQHVLQLTHNGEVTVNGDVAHGRWYVTEYGLTAKGKQTFYVAHYDDDYRRTSEGWKFQSRVVTWHYHGEPDLTGIFGPPPGY